MVTAAVAEVAVVEVVKFWYNNRFDHPVIICAGNDGMVKAVNIPDFNTGGALNPPEKVAMQPLPPGNHKSRLGVTL